MTTAFDLAKQLYALQFGPDGLIALYDLAAKTTDQTQQNAIYGQIGKMSDQLGAIKNAAGYADNGGYFSWAYYEAQKWPNGPPSTSQGSNYTISFNPNSPIQGEQLDKIFTATPAIKQSASEAIQSSSPEARQAAADAAAAQAKQTADAVQAIQDKSAADTAAAQAKTQADADAINAANAQRQAEQAASAAQNDAATAQVNQGLIDSANAATAREAANAQAAKDAQAAQQAEQAKNDALMAQYRAADQKTQEEATQRGIIQTQQAASAAQAAKDAQTAQQNSPVAKFTAALQAWGDDPQNPDTRKAYNDALDAARAADPNALPDSVRLATEGFTKTTTSADVDAAVKKAQDDNAAIQAQMASPEGLAAQVQAYKDAQAPDPSKQGYAAFKASRDAYADANGAPRGQGAFDTDYHNWLSDVAMVGWNGQNTYMASTPQEKTDVAKYMSTELVPPSIWATMSPEMQKEALRDPSSFYGAINQLSFGATDKGLFNNGTGSVTSLAGLKFGANGTGFDTSGVRTLSHSEAHADREGGAQTFGTLLTLGISLVVPGAALALGEALGASGAAAGALGGSIISGSIASATGGDVLRGAVSGGVAGYLGAAEGAGAASNGSEYAFSDGASMGTAIPNADIAGATGLIESAGATGGDALTSGGMEEFGNSTGIPVDAGNAIDPASLVNDATTAASTYTGTVGELAADGLGGIPQAQSFLDSIGTNVQEFANKLGSNFKSQFMTSTGELDTTKILKSIGKQVLIRAANGQPLDLQGIAEGTFFSATGQALGKTIAGTDIVQSLSGGNQIAANTIGATLSGGVIGAATGNDPLNSALYSGVATGATGLIGQALGVTPGDTSLTNTASNIVAGAVGNAAGAAAVGGSFGDVLVSGLGSGATSAAFDAIFSNSPTSSAATGNQIGGNQAVSGTPNAADATLTRSDGESTSTTFNTGDAASDPGTIDTGTQTVATIDNPTATLTPTGGTSTVATIADTSPQTPPPETINGQIPANVSPTTIDNQPIAGTGIINQIQASPVTNPDAVLTDGQSNNGVIADTAPEIPAPTNPANTTNPDGTVETTPGNGTENVSPPDATSNNGTIGGNVEPPPAPPVTQPPAPIIVTPVPSTPTPAPAPAPYVFGAPSFGSVFSHYADLTKDRNVNWNQRTFNGG